MPPPKIAPPPPAAPATGAESTATVEPETPVPPPTATLPAPTAPTGGAIGSGAATGPPGHGRATAIAVLYRRLENHRRYPLQARRRGIEGTVGLRFRVEPNGSLAAAEIAHTSGSRLLDRAALRTLDHCFPLDSTAAGLLAGEPITVDLTFRLVGE